MRLHVMLLVVLFVGLGGDAAEATIGIAHDFTPDSGVMETAQGNPGTGSEIVPLPSAATLLLTSLCALLGFRRIARRSVA